MPQAPHLEPIWSTRLTMTLIRTTVIHMNSTTRNQIAAEVRAATARAGLTHADLARETGMSPQTIRRKLRGERALTVEELIDIADAAGCPVSDLLPSVSVGSAAA